MNTPREDDDDDDGDQVQNLPQTNQIEKNDLNKSCRQFKIINFLLVFEGQGHDL